MTRSNLLGVVVFGLLGCEPRTDLALWHDDSTDGEISDPAASSQTCGFGQKVCFGIVSTDAPLPACGESLELEGPLFIMGPDRVRIEDCGGCESCQGPSYELHLRAPRDWQPESWPGCARISLEFADAGVPWACAWTSGAIWSAPVAPGQPPLYVAASIEPTSPQTVTTFQVAAELETAKPCRDEACCPTPPGTYTLAVVSGTGAALSLAEDEARTDIELADTLFEAKNLRSHVHDRCEDAPHFDWIVRRSAEQGAPLRVSP